MLNLQNKALIGIFLWVMSYCSVTLASPQVVVTLKPIHSLVAAVMDGVATPQLLLPDYASPHTFQLKPSNLKQLKNADLIIWVGPELENFMEKPLSQLKPAWGTLTLRDIPHLQRLPQRIGRNWGDPHEHEHEHHHDADNLDPHFWLSTDNAAVIVNYLATFLSQKDPEHAQQYQQNAKLLQNSLQTLKTQLQVMLKPVQKQPFLVYHDGYQYFEKEFSLNGVGTMVVNPHLPLSAQGLKTIQTIITQNHVRCVFRETEFSDKTIYNSLLNMNIKVAELDPLGAHQKAGPRAYKQIMFSIGSTMRHCLLNESK